MCENLLNIKRLLKTVEKNTVAFTTEMRYTNLDKH